MPRRVLQGPRLLLSCFATTLNMRLLPHCCMSFRHYVWILASQTEEGEKDTSHPLKVASSKSHTTFLPASPLARANDV